MENLTEKGTQEEERDVRAYLHRQEIAYAMNMLHLQEKAGLTYKEARAHLTSYRGESRRGLAMTFGVSLHAIYNMQLRAKQKISESSLTEKEIFGEYHPDEPSRLEGYPIII
jgi:hypothetical protein